MTENTRAFSVYDDKLFNRAATGWVRFLLCTGFIIVFLYLPLVYFFLFFFVGEQRQTSIWRYRVRDFESRNLWYLLAKSCWNINRRKMLRILFPLMHVKYIGFSFIEALDLNRILNTLRIDEMCWHCSFHFCYVTNKS